MVPFSFPQPLLKSRVMQNIHRHFWWCTEFGIRCFWPFLPSCFPYGHSGLCENLRKTQFAKIQVNPTKSNLFFYGSRAKNAKVAKGERFIFETRALPSCFRS